MEGIPEPSHDGTWSISDGKVIVTDRDGTSTITFDDAPAVHSTGKFTSNDENGTFTIDALTSGLVDSDCENSSSDGSSSSSSSELPQKRRVQLHALRLRSFQQQRFEDR